jgi:hypothetical protein
MSIEEGIASPVFNGIKEEEQELFSDRIEIFKPIASQ